MPGALYDLHLGAEASPSRLRGSLRGYSVLHLAAHGYVDAEEVQRSGLALSFNAGEPGWLTIADVLEKGGKADVSGISKGKGFQGVMKRHNFSGQGASHGVHKVHRAPGAIGACATPARVFKGQKMAGRMGGERTTMLNLEVVEVDSDRGLVLLGGSVPGPKGAVVLVREAVKN